jgi:hypothetical protein
MSEERFIAFALLLPAWGLAGCAEANEHLRADPRLIAQVQVSKLEPGPGCQAMGALDASSGECQESGYESAYEALRNKAALRSGNYVVIDSVYGPHPLISSVSESVVVIQGRLFSCTAPPVARAAPLPAGRSYVAERWPVLPAAPLPPLQLVSDDGCDPSCSPGFVCSRGSCVSACNPICGQGLRCGEDRVCR